MLDCSQEAQRAMITQLDAERRQTGTLSGERIAAVAASFGMSPRTIQRWLAVGVPNGAERREKIYKPSDDVLRLYFECHGRPAKVAERLTREGHSCPSLPTLYRGFERALTRGQRALARTGDEGLRAYSLYVRWEATYRNRAWQADHKQMPVRTLLIRGLKPVRPWWTVFIDVYSRAVMGWVISVSHTSGDVLAALRRSLEVDPERGPFGGVPDVLVWDNALEFASADVKAACHRVGGITPDPIEAFSPHLQGKVEAINGTFEEECLADLPTFLHGPRGADDRLLNRLDNAVMPIRLLVVRVAQWVDWYNNERPHGALGGQTPRQRWEADASPIRQVAPGMLRTLLLARKRRKAQKSGIPWDNLMFFHESLHGYVGEEVEVAYVPYERRWIDVYRLDGTFICTAVPQGALSHEQAKEYVKRRNAADWKARKYQATARRVMRTRLTSMTQDAPDPEITNPPTRAEARRKRSKRAAGRGKDPSRDDMLGLDEYVDTASAMATDSASCSRSATTDSGRTQEG